MQPLTEFEGNFYACYPHANGFLPDGKGLVVGCREEKACSLWLLDISTGRLRELLKFDGIRMQEPFLYFDVSLETGVLGTFADGCAWAMDLLNGGDARVVHRVKEGDVAGSLVSLRADGSRMLLPVKRGESHGVIEIETATGQSRELLFDARWVNHFHYCPCDEDWIGFSHEGPAGDIQDRVWGWHEDEMPGGRCLFDQASDSPGNPLQVGHERWCFHDCSVLAVAYGASDAGPRGIYEIFANGGAPRLVSGGDRDWHVNVSRDGRWAVVDTTGPHDMPGKGWENSGRASDLLAINMITGERRFVAHSRQSGHPSHPHPFFSPDGRWIFFNESDEVGGRNRILKAPNPFLGALE